MSDSCMHANAATDLCRSLTKSVN